MTTKLGTNLITLREPSLWMRSSKDRAVVAYRLLWIASNRDPVCVRVTKTGSVFSLRLSRHDRSFNGLAGKVTVSKEVKLTEKQWKQLTDSVQATKFWTAPAEPEERRGLTDGDIILIEGVKDGKYHLIHRSGSTAGESYKRFCRLLLELSGTDFINEWDHWRKIERDFKDYVAEPKETPDLGDP